MIALIGFLKKERGILRTKSLTVKENFVDTVEIFGKEICLVLTLMKYFPVKILVC